VRERLAVSVLRDFERFCDHRHRERDRQRDRETECERGREMKSMAVRKAAMSQGLEMSRALNCSRERDNGGLLGGVGGLRQCKTDRVRLTGLAPPSLHTQKSKLEVRAGTGNTYGTVFRVTTFGESHGGGVGCVIDGCPPRLPLSEADMQVELDRR
jgi:hypothetical protein